MEDPIKPTLQSIILRLQEYWAGQGCVIWQPYHTEVGAGTMNPGTYLRVLGPEDWRVAYVEPSIRPTDSRYGENPNRWGHYYQFQVIIKPDPGNPLELYLNSLIALGIDPQRHDIRFVEDNWEQPALGAWGLGWEVWLDGQEITQYTYFQQAGGKPLDPVSVEITYGLERIQLALQQVESFVDLDWNEYLTYGEVNLTAEREHSRYTYDVADVDRLRRLYDEYEAEAELCLEAGLVFPAHDYVLKCSHTFNLLDGRGAIGVTERAGLFTRMREQARRVTDAYLEEREELGYPWRNRWQGGAPAPPVLTLGEAPKTPDTFVLEIGTEELPVGDLTAGLAQLETAFTSMLEDERLGYHQLQVFGTPRRLVVQIEDLATAQEPRVSMEKGPPAERAFDSQGKPTKAAEGFARSKGVAVGQLSTAEIDGGEYVVVQVEETGESSGAVLQTQIPEILSSLRFEKSMRWNASQVNFSRPIRWILAMYGSAVVPFEFAGIPSGRTTRLMRFEDPETIELKDAKEYSNSLTSRQILLDPEARREAIQSQINELASEIGGEIPEDPNLLDEVANLVERPTALRGEFDREYLQLPRPVLVSVMKKHQRYFPVVKKENLLPYFIAVRNGGGEHIETVRQGNEHVIAARFADAAYFIQRDIQQPLEAYLPRLATLTFQSELGSMLDKTERIEKLTRSLGEQLELSKAELEIANRAAQLAKADLATLMVIEMTSLQGEIGREYALRSGEAPGVAEAIFEHYLPRHAGDSLPKSKPGIVVGLADRLDSLVGLFAIGSVPTGARDPFGLRRAAISMIQILIHHQIQFDIRTALDVAAQIQPVEATTSALDECFRYIVGRQQGLLLVEGYPHDAVTAVLAGQGNNPYGASVAVQQLATWRQREDWDQILQSFARCVRITRDIGEQYEVRASTLVEKAEKELFKALERAEEHTRSPGSVDEFFEVFLPMIPAITNFFDDVLVMAEDDALRENRLALLQRIVRLSHGVMDLSDLEGF